MNYTFALLAGESQSGKSTIINCVAGKTVAKVGIGNGYSVTHHTCVYASNAHRLQLMDSPGGLDTNLRSDKDILNEIEYAITTKSSKTAVDAILLVESLTSDTMQLQRNLQRLKTRFGPNILQSIIVLGTKPNLSKILYGNTRITAVTQQCAALKLKFIPFETYSNYQNKTMMNGAQLNNQMNALKNLISQIKPYGMNSIAQIRKNIQDKAAKLMNAAPVQYKTQYYNESYSEPYAVNESYQASENYVDNESYQDTESYQVVEHYTENVWDVVGKKHNVFKYGFRPKKQWGWVQVGRTRMVTRTRPVTKTRSVNKTRTVTKYRNATKYRSKTRQKSMQVAIPKDINIYVTQATNQWEQQMKQSLKAAVDFL